MNEAGIWLDYSNHTWIIAIQDEKWLPEEIKNFNKNKFQIALYQKKRYICFIVMVDDVIEPSDCPLVVCDFSEEALQSLEDTVDYQVQVHLLDGNGVLAKREISLTSKNSRLLKELLRQEKSFELSDEEYDLIISSFQQSIEPVDCLTDVCFIQ